MGEKEKMASDTYFLTHQSLDNLKKKTYFGFPKTLNWTKSKNWENIMTHPFNKVYTLSCRKSWFLLLLACMYTCRSNFQGEKKVSRNQTLDCYFCLFVLQWWGSNPGPHLTNARQAPLNHIPSPQTLDCFMRHRRKMPIVNPFWKVKWDFLTMKFQMHSFM